MPGDAAYAVARLHTKCVIDGDEYECAQVTMTYEMNAIPTCTCMLAVGRNVKDLQPAQVHKTFEKLKVRSKFELFFWAEPLAEQGGAWNIWPEEPLLIFEGVVVGTGWQRSTSGAQFTVHAQHWLVDLHYSSALSGSSHPGNPADFTFSAGFVPMLTSGAGGDQQVDWIPGDRVKGITAASLNSDLWENVLKKWMQTVAEQEPIDERLAPIVGNAAALDALERMISKEMAMKFDSNPNDEQLGNAVMESLNTAITKNDIHTTLWGKLVGDWSPQYWFAVIPRVKDAYVVPFVGALSGGYHVAIWASEYVQCDLHSSLPHVLRCVGISFPEEYAAGGNANPAHEKAKRRGLAGLWPVPADDKGLILIKDAPRWLTAAMQGDAYSAYCCGITPERVPIQTIYTPKGTGPAQNPEFKPEDAEKEWVPILDQYAHQWFMIEMLKGRTGELSGRLRFDVAPGSTVLVEAGIDPFVQVQGGDGLGERFYATVAKTTILINSEVQRAGTSFSLAHVRTEAENEDPKLSVPEPPLYKRGWFGDTLEDSIQAPG